MPHLSKWGIFFIIHPIDWMLNLRTERWKVIVIFWNETTKPAKTGSLLSAQMLLPCCKPALQN